MDEVNSGNSSGSEGGNESSASGLEAPDAGSEQGGTGESGSSEGQAQSGGGESSGVGDEGNESFIKGDDGKDYIPREAFEARIAKLTSQKNEARGLLDSLRNDPVIRKEFLESLNLEEKRPISSNEHQEPTAFDKWIAPLPPEHQAHYKGLVEAIAPQFEDYVQAQIAEVMKPITSWIGEQKVSGFAKSNPDFAKYERTVAKIVMDGRAKSIEDAYKIASYEDRLKNVAGSGAKAEATRRDKLNRTPIAGKSQTSVQIAPKKPNGLKGALEKAWADMGGG